MKLNQYSSLLAHNPETFIKQVSRESNLNKKLGLSHYQFLANLSIMI